MSMTTLRSDSDTTTTSTSNDDGDLNLRLFPKSVSVRTLLGASAVQLAMGESAM